MTTLIFDYILSGHHMEYLHHYYAGALKLPREEFIFVVPYEFHVQKKNQDWPDSNNIEFDYISDNEILQINNATGWKRRKLLLKLINIKTRKHRANRILLTTLTSLFPYILFGLPRGVKARGIVYRIYLYTKTKVSPLRYWVDVFSFFLMAKCSALDKVFILNDRNSAETLNSLYKTNKYTYIPDPIPEIDKNQLVNLRSQYKIPVDNKVYFHFGGLTERKGTLEILQAINILSDEDAKKMTFVFAGRVYNSMRVDFYELVKKTNKKTQVLVFDEFCSYDFLFNMCFTSDVILIPYKYTELSSGVLGYAAFFHKPVIGPSSGLLGAIIKKYNLGISLDEISSNSIAQVLLKDISYIENNYCSDNSIENFQNLIFS